MREIYIGVLCIVAIAAIFVNVISTPNIRSTEACIVSTPLERIESSNSIELISNIFTEKEWNDIRLGIFEAITYKGGCEAIDEAEVLLAPLLSYEEARVWDYHNILDFYENL